MRDTLEERYCNLGAPGTVVNGDLVSLLFGVAFPQRNSDIGSVFAQNVVGHVDELELIHIVAIVPGDALEGVHAGFERRHAPAHVLDDGVRSGNLDVLFPAAGSAGGTHVLIGIAAGANDRRIAAASGELEGESASGGDAGHLD